MTVKVANNLNGVSNGQTAKNNLTNTPGTPKITSISSPKTGQIKISWSNPNPGSVTGFRIERQKGSGGWITMVDDTADTDTTLTDVGDLTSGQNYSYRVSAKTAEGVGSPSTGVSIACT